MITVYIYTKSQNLIAGGVVDICFFAVGVKGAIAAGSWQCYKFVCSRAGKYLIATSVRWLVVNIS